MASLQIRCLKSPETWQTHSLARPPSTPLEASWTWPLVHIDAKVGNRSSRGFASLLILSIHIFKKLADEASRLNIRTHIWSADAQHQWIRGLLSLRALENENLCPEGGVSHLSALLCPSCFVHEHQAASASHGK